MTNSNEAEASSPGPHAAPKTAHAQGGLQERIARRRELLKKQEAERKLPLQIFIIILNSLGVAFIAAMGMTLAVRNAPSGSMLAGPEFKALALLMSFLLGFFFSLLFLVRRLPENWWALLNEIAAAKKYEAPNEKWGGLLNAAPGDYTPLFDLRQIGEARPPALAPKQDETSFERPGAALASGEAVGGPAGPDDAALAHPLFNDENIVAQEMNTNVTALEAEQAKGYAAAEIHRFTKAVTSAVLTGLETIDAATRFAMNLFIAGGCSAVAKKFMLSTLDIFKLMQRALNQAGTNRAFAESFIGNIEDYAARRTCRELIMRGHDAMTMQLTGKTEPAIDAPVILAWSQEPANRALLPRVVTFLVTDIVDAKALTQRLGNLNTQRILKAHDEAVIEAVQKHKGRVVQHMGDGLMTTFPDPGRALQAAQAIQQKLDVHNKRMPHLTANVRIAINAGEATEENGAYTGAAVKMTAQICSMARAGEILAAETIRTFCVSSQQAFTHYSDTIHPGLGKKQPVFEISWRDMAARVDYAEIGRTGA